MADLSFRAMGSPCRVVVEGASTNAADRARRCVDELERRWSRFLPDSKISWLNRRSGEPALVSELTAALLRRAVFASLHTDGLFDPLLLHELELLGYDRSHELLDNGDGTPDDPFVPSQARDSLEAFDGPARLVELPAGRPVDPGGIGKGYAADLVAAQLLTDGANWVVVVLGGDVRVCGERLKLSTIEVEIQDPFDPTRVAGSLRVDSGAVATSSTLRRRWRTSDGEQHHHLLDPRTRMPACTDLAAATVVAGETWWAEALAKAAVISGGTKARELIGRQGASALLTHTDGMLEHIGYESSH